MLRYLAFSIVVLALAGVLTAFLNAHSSSIPSSQTLRDGKDSGRSTAPGGVGGHQSHLSAVPGNI